MLKFKLDQDQIKLCHKALGFMSKFLPKHIDIYQNLEGKVDEYMYLSEQEYKILLSLIGTFGENSEYGHWRYTCIRFQQELIRQKRRKRQVLTGLVSWVKGAK